VNARNAASERGDAFDARRTPIMLRQAVSQFRHFLTAAMD